MPLFKTCLITVTATLFLMACSTPIIRNGDVGSRVTKPGMTIRGPTLWLYNKHDVVQCTFDLIADGQLRTYRLEHVNYTECPKHRWDVWKWEIKDAPPGSEFSFMQDDACGEREDVVSLYVVAADMTKGYKIGPHKFKPLFPIGGSWDFTGSNGATVRLTVENQWDNLDWFWCFKYRIPVARTQLKPSA